MFKVVLHLCLWVCLLGLVSCTSPHYQPENRSADQSDGHSPQVLVINSNRQIERYRIAEMSFASQFDKAEFDRIDLVNEREPDELLLDKLNQGSYDAVYCIGAKSLGIIDYIDAGLPVVFSSVQNWRRFQGNSRFYGVASEVSHVAQLTWFKYFFPELDTLGVIYSEKNQALIEEAKKVASGLNINLRVVRVDVGSSIEQKAAALLDKVQALWLISDLAVLSSENRVASLFALAGKKRIPVLTYNELFIDMGAVLSISADLPTTGRQAALLMRDVLQKNTPEDKVIYPAGSRIILNQATLELSDLKINEDAMDSLSDIRY